jgi:adenosylcobinamide-phosphate synthase
MNTAGLLALAMLLDAALGEPAWLWSRLPHPAVLTGRAIGWLDARLNHGAARRANGIFALTLLAGGAVILGMLVATLGPVVRILCAAILLAQRSLAEHVMAAGDGLRVSLPRGRSAVARIVSRDCRDMDRAQVARAAIESGAENLSDGVVAPAFWFLVAGLPGLFLYKAVNTADSMIGYRNDRYAAFGWASARADDLLNLIPARLTGLLVAAVSGRLRHWRAIARDARRHRSPNAGWPEAAMARALDIALSGPRSYDGKMRDLAWANGDARRIIGPDDVSGAVRLMWRAWAALLALVIATAVLLPLI